MVKFMGYYFVEMNLAMDEIMDLLRISKGSTSQGLRALRQLGAISLMMKRVIVKKGLLPKSV